MIQARKNSPTEDQVCGNPSSNDKFSVSFAYGYGEIMRFKDKDRWD